MNKEETKALNLLASSCFGIYEIQEAGMEWRMAHLILARDVAEIAAKHGEAGAATSYAKDLQEKCSRLLEEESKKAEPGIEL